MRCIQYRIRLQENETRFIPFVGEEKWWNLVALGNRMPQAQRQYRGVEENRAEASHVAFPLTRMHNMAICAL